MVLPITGVGRGVTIPYYFKVVERGGTNHAVRIPGETGAFTVRPVWELDAAGSLDFDIQTVDSDAALMIPTQREIQWWYDNGSTPKLKWWGPVWRREARGKTTHIQCEGLPSYLNRVQLGPVRTEYLTDPDMQDPALAAYTAVGATMSSSTTIVRKGTRSMKLVSGAAGLDQYAYQRYTFDNSAGTIPVAIFHRARFYFVNTGATPELGPAFDERGLYVRTIESGVTQAQVWTPIASTGAPRNQWVKVFAPPIVVPAGHIQTVEVRWYSPGGTIYWATSAGRIEESTGANTPTTYADLNTIIANALASAQDTSADHTDFHLAGPSGSFGLTLSRQFQYFNHGLFWAVVVKPLVDAGIIDIDVLWNEATPTTRTLTTWASRGTTPGLTLTLGVNADLSAYPQDGLSTSGRITGIPQGNSSEFTLTPSGQPAGTTYAAVDDQTYAADTSANGGVVFDEIISALPESTLDQLSSQVSTELARRKNLVAAPVIVTPLDAWWASGAVLGDTITIAGSYGWCGTTSAPFGDRRVMKLEAFPENNLMAVTAA